MRTASYGNRIGSLHHVHKTSSVQLPADPIQPGDNYVKLEQFHLVSDCSLSKEEGL
jgi:hypothetical protein